MVRPYDPRAWSRSWLTRVIFLFAVTSMALSVSVSLQILFVLTVRPCRGQPRGDALCGAFMWFDFALLCIALLSLTGVVTNLLVSLLTRRGKAID